MAGGDREVEGHSCEHGLRHCGMYFCVLRLGGDSGGGFSHGIGVKFRSYSHFRK